MRVFWRRDCGKNVNKTKNILMTKPNVRKQSRYATEPPIPGPNRYPKSRFQSKAPPEWEHRTEKARVVPLCVLAP